MSTLGLRLLEAALTTFVSIIAAKVFEDLFDNEFTT